ncbi:MAG: hypothetical protein JNK76_03740 [Planctomycetales bacterium]|nr:hypothetical protein [Planctomycetales bacterium]MBN8625550.1 hypothetical protein [Planctomycetota bacterium]
MSTSLTRTTTFTASDIRKVVDNFAADFSMMGQATGLKTREQIASTVGDLKIFAETGFLTEVTVILKDANGKQIRGAIYKVSESAVGWQSDRPGGNLWPRTPGGALKVVATVKDSWFSKTPEQKTAFAQAYGLTGTWPLTDEDTSLSGLTASYAQKYASNGYGMERTNYT